MLKYQDQENHQETGEENKWKLEIKYLKRLLEEVEEKNNILKENNNLLKEKLQSLEVELRQRNADSEEPKTAIRRGGNTKTLSEQICPKKLLEGTDTIKTKVHQNIQKNKQNGEPYKQTSDVKTVNKEHVINQIIQGTSYSQVATTTTTNNSLKDLEDQQRRIMSDVINLVPQKKNK